MEKCIVRQDKESEEDALIDILKSLMGECKAVYKRASSRGTNEIQGGYLITVKEEGDISGTLRYQLPSKELNPRGFNLLCTINTIDSNDEMQKPKDGHKKVKNFEKITLIWNVCKPVRVFYDNKCGKNCGMWSTCNPDLSFCSEYYAIYRKGKMECSNNGCVFRTMKDKALGETV
nr:hypothetical protein [Tanacetum cinerariifolium]